MKPEDIAYLEQCLRENDRTYNSEQLAVKLEEERGVTLNSTQIRRILKKGWRWKCTRQGHRDRQEPTVKALAEAQLSTLESAATTE